MKRLLAIASLFAAVVLLSSIASATTSGDRALAKFSSAWENLKSYTCTVTAHEVSGSRVQDRTYEMKFRKPLDTRMDITSGDGRGGAAVWNGGDTVRGHQGGFLSFIRLNLNIHDSKAVSVRGATIAETNFGWLINHIKGLKGATIDAVPDGDKTRINVAVADPASDGNVTKEAVILGADSLPIEYDQWEGDNLVKQLVYIDLKLNVDVPDSAFNL